MKPRTKLSPRTAPRTTAGNTARTAPGTSARSSAATSAGDRSSLDVELLSELFDHAPDVAFFVKDRAGRYVVVNDSLAERHGLASKSEAIGKQPHEICPGEFGRIPSEQDAKVLDSGKPLVDHLEMQWHRPHDPIWCLTTKLPIRDADGRVTGLIGFSRDVRQPVNPQEIPGAFAEAVKDFDSNLAADITPSVLAERSGLTPQRLARLTKRLFGLTPGQLITKTRVAAASSLLRESTRSVAQIAQDCGFFDHSAFTRAFRSATGVTPTEYRKTGG